MKDSLLVQPASQLLVNTAHGDLSSLPAPPQSISLKQPSLRRDKEIQELHQNSSRNAAPPSMSVEFVNGLGHTEEPCIGPPPSYRDPAIHHAIPSYEDATTPFPLTVNLKQTLPASEAATMFPDAPLWARLLGVALAREWLHSSGILSTLTIPVTSELSFEALESQVLSKFQQGSHGRPWKRLRWVYVLRGKWLGADGEEAVVLERGTWEGGRRLMMGMMDVRVDLAFCFMSADLGKTGLPEYRELFAGKSEDDIAGDAPGRPSHVVEAKTAEAVVADGRMRPGSRPHALRRLLTVRRPQRQHV